jgi:hypothetical protein
MARHTLEDAFDAGFLAGMSVVHDKDVDAQQAAFYKAWRRREDRWLSKTLDKILAEEA